MSPTAPLPSNPERSPADPSAAHGAIAWGQLVDTALRQRGTVTNDPLWSLKAGQLQPQLLCRYAAGRATHSERLETEGFLIRAPWAMQRVTALVKGTRAGQETPLAKPILTAACEGEVNPYRVAAQVLLDSLEATEASAAIERQESSAIEEMELEPLVKAACLLGLQRLDEAKTAFAQLSSLENPLAQLAQRVANLSGEDEALVELLSAV